MKIQLRLSHLLCLTLVWGNLLFPDLVTGQVKTRIVLTDGGTSAIRHLIETALTNVIREINKTAVGSGNLDSVRQFCTEAGFSSIRTLVENDRFFCSIVEVRTNLIEVFASDYFEVRGIRVSLGNRNNKSDIFEYLVFTLNSNGIIVDFNYALEELQYENILASGKGVSNEQRRSQIANFLETYRTSYNRKDMPYLERVFSDNALIIVGHVIRESKQSNDFISKRSSLGNSKVKLLKKSKHEYLEALRTKVFERNSWIKVGFSTVKVTEHPRVPDIYGVNIKQEWNSEYYSDTGYLFLLFDFRNAEEVIIRVRSWQPRPFEDGSIVTLGYFKIID